MQIIWRRRALNDLDAIRNFIAQDNPQAAARVRDTIATSVERLARHPNLGRAGRVDRTRELTIPRVPYVVVYRVAEDRVRILAVIHTSRQWPEEL